MLGASNSPAELSASTSAGSALCPYHPEQWLLVLSGCHALDKVTRATEGLTKPFPLETGSHDVAHPGFEITILLPVSLKV